MAATFSSQQSVFAKPLKQAAPLPEIDPLPPEIDPSSLKITPSSPKLNPFPPQIDPLPPEIAPLLPINAQPLRLEIQLSKRQVVLYKGNTKVKSYPIAIGKPGWETPKGTYQVKQMIPNPTWINPLTGAVIQGGDPENPLGKFWIGFWTDGRDWIGFHGTPNTKSVGKAASHGCVRMYNKDVTELFSKVSLGTEVTVVD